MLWSVDTSSPQPLFEQVAASVRRGIAAGEVAQGERLPAARDLAESLGVHMHTVLKAYQVLRDEGLVELRRGRGAVVLAARPDQARVHELARALVTEAGRLGIGREELAHRIREGEWS